MRVTSLMPKNILLVGSGGREHCIAWALAKSNHKVFISPGALI